MNRNPSSNRKSMTQRNSSSKSRIDEMAKVRRI